MSKKSGKENKKGVPVKVKKSAFIALIALLFVLTGASAAFVYAIQLDDKLYANTYVGEVNISRLTKEEATQNLQDQFDRMLENGLTISYNQDQSANIPLQRSGATDPDLIINLIDVEIADHVDAAFAVDHSGNRLYAVWKAVESLFIPTIIDLEPTILTDQIDDAIHTAFADIETPATATDFAVEFDGDDINVSVVPGTRGMELDTDLVFTILEKDINDLYLQQIETELVQTEKPMPTVEAEALIPAFIDVLDSAPLALSYTSDVGRNYAWNINRSNLAEWIRPVSSSETGMRALAFEPEQMDALWEEIREDINIAPVDARFEIIDGRVQEFQGSQEGREFDQYATVKALNAALQSELQEVTIVANTTEPDISTGEVNNLGITEVIGVGESNFRGSDSARIQNLIHGSNKLNGLLIAPGETTGLIKHLRPFTLADGYTMGYAILGESIEPVIGGGLCQLGTTVFRAAMNSGITIEERRNHSLVVSYYDDARNGNPGTDATLYDTGNDNTLTDLVITNDTEHHILMTTAIDIPSTTLTYTFWGTSDGRNAYYTPPTVLSRSGYGETVYKETTDLAPGQTRCQHPYAGATTSFDYIVEYADGTVKEENYTSRYRSLPRICLVGIDPNAPDEGDGQGGAGAGPTTELQPEDVLEDSAVPVE